MKTIEKPQKTKKTKGAGPKYSKTIEKTKKNQKNQRSEQLWGAWRVTQMARTRFLVFLGLQIVFISLILNIEDPIGKPCKVIEQTKKNKNHVRAI